jgi:hypothetical protein
MECRLFVQRFVDLTSQPEILPRQATLVVCRQLQFDSVVLDVDVGVMIHGFGEPGNAANEPNPLCEIFEDKESRYLFSSQSPPVDFRHFRPDFISPQFHGAISSRLRELHGYFVFSERRSERTLTVD